MKEMFKQSLGYVIRICSHFYTYKIHCWLSAKRNDLYTMWIRNFIGEVGTDTKFAKPLLLQGMGEKRIRIGSHSSIGSHCILGCWEKYGKNQQFNPSIEIGNHCIIGEYNHISAINKITIGDGLLTGRYVYIGDNSHGDLSWKNSDISPSLRTLMSKGVIVIGRNVWIGDKSTILSGVTIGDNVIVGANSVVTHDIPSNTIVGGVSSKELKRLINKDIIEY